MLFASKFGGRWIGEEDYDMQSVQFDANDKPTGLFYAGPLVRIAGSKR